MKRKPFTGALTAKTAATGIHFANENARSLLADAELLYVNGRYERCAALAILAIEEAGKSTILRSI